MARVLSGIDAIDSVDALLRGRRLGLMTNPTGVDHRLRSTIDLLHGRYGLSALYAVEHGIRGDIQAGEAVASFTDPQTGLRVHSAYGAGSFFTEEMLADFDVLVFDLQDVGARFYTYLYSLSRAMQACARAGKHMVVLDRVNPLGGVTRSGTVLQPETASFVGDHGLPTRYGLTIGEYALYVRRLLKLDLPLTVVPLRGWRRDMLLGDTDLPWVAPSPNMPGLDTARCYIGTCLFEGTNISEGRGTTQPFQLVGAPWLDGTALAREMNALPLPGVVFRPVSFTPTFSKHQGCLCHGVQLHLMDREADAFGAGLHLLETIRRLSGDRMTLLPPDDTGYTHLEHLLGTTAFTREGASAEDIIRTHGPLVDRFALETEDLLLYR